MRRPVPLLKRNLPDEQAPERRMLPSDQALEELIANLRREENLFHDRLTIENLKVKSNPSPESDERESCWFLRNGTDDIFGFVALWPVQKPASETRGFTYVELGPLWLREDKRDQGLARTLFIRAISKAPKGCHLFLITKAGAVEKIVREARWGEIANWQDGSFWMDIYDPLKGQRTPHENAKLFYTVTPK